MASPLLALCAAMSWSISHLFVRLGSRSVAPLVGVVLSLASSSIVLSIALLIRGVVRPELGALGFFVLAGMIGPGLGRILSINAISRIGATRASPVQAAAQPIMTVVLGVFVLSETVGLSRFAGIALTLTGVLIVVRSGQRNAARDAAVASAAAGDTLTTTGIRTSLKVLLWPLGAGAAFATADLVRKGGMQVMDDAFFGGATGVLVALTIWGTVLVVRGQGPTLLEHARSANAKWFMASGAASGAAQVFVLSALRDGDLSLVGPIVSTQPIIIAIIARILMNRLEKVGLAVAVAAMLAAAGTILISL